MELPKEWALDDVPKDIVRKWEEMDVYTTCTDAVAQPLSADGWYVGIKLVPVMGVCKMFNHVFVSMLADGMVKSEAVPLMAVLRFILMQVDLDEDGLVLSEIPFPVGAHFVSTHCPSHPRAVAKAFAVDVACFTEAFAVALSKPEFMKKLLKGLREENDVFRDICLNFFRRVFVCFFRFVIVFWFLCAEVVQHDLTNQAMRRVFAHGGVMTRFVRGIHHFMKNMRLSEWIKKDLLLMLMDVLFRVCHRGAVNALRGEWDLICEMTWMVFQDEVLKEDYFPYHFFVDIVERMVSTDPEHFGGGAVGVEIRSFLRNSRLFCWRSEQVSRRVFFFVQVPIECVRLMVEF